MVEKACTDDRARTEANGPFTGKLAPKPEIRNFVFKPEAKPILKIEPEKVGRFKTERLKRFMEDRTRIMSLGFSNPGFSQRAYLKSTDLKKESVD
jgi:hypothetical protein